ncbi:MAG: hypothetical protein WC365_02595 [Candidatus Babeliales bacterium]|jgi:hypothetical protein
MQKLMIRKLIKGSLLIIIIGGCSIPTIMLVKKLSTTSSTQLNNLFVPQTVTYELESIFDATARSAIQEFVHRTTHQKSLITFDREQFYKDLKQAFPILKRVEYEFRAPDTLHCKLVGTTPYCRINDRFILGNKRRLFPLASFSEFNQQTLPRITLNEKLLGKKLDQSLYAFIHAIPQETWRSYQIFYKAPWEIHLIPTTAICHCRIITDQKNFFNQQKFGALSTLFKDLCDRGYITKNMLGSKGIPLAFDFRIKDQVIVKFHEPSKRGRGS